ncbi:neurotransmitter-gated ion-channel ligand-binding protein [Peteryoungia ipomoeae]|nr:neurotransmitter-gated ion-channel ligand-binding protein [Peteryoungia ipomoeae]
MALCALKRLACLLFITLSLCSLPRAGAAATPAPLPSGVFLPIQVHVAVRILNVSRIAATEGEASMMVELTERWSNPALAFDPKVSGFGRIDTVGDEAVQTLSSMWTPGTEIENQITTARTEATSVSVRADGTVTRIRRIDADFRVDIDMTSFPFDHQDLTLSMVSPRHAADEVIYVMNDLDREMSSIETDVSASNWTGKRLSVVMERYHGWNARPFVRVKAMAEVERAWQYYVLPLFVPFLAVTSVAVFILWARVSLIGDKAPITYSALLALAALSFTYESSFPGSISMNSPIAVMVSLGYFYLIAVLLTDIVLIYADYPGKQRYPHLEPEIRAYIRLAIPAIFLLICLSVAFNALT